MKEINKQKVIALMTSSNISYQMSIVSHSYVKFE